MPWKERSIVEERMRFVFRLKDGESMSATSVARRRHAPARDSLA